MHHALAVQLKENAATQFRALGETLEKMGGDAATLLRKHGIALEGYKKACAAMQSRSTVLQIIDAGTKETTFLVCLPGGGADQFNHSPEVDGECFRLTAEGRLQVVASQDYKAGEQVYITYGKELSTSQLLFSYGFAYPDSLLASGMGIPLSGDYISIVHEVPATMASKADAARQGFGIDAVACREEEEHISWELEVLDDESLRLEFRLRPGKPLPWCWLIHTRMMQLTDEEAEELQVESSSPPLPLSFPSVISRDTLFHRQELHL